MINSEELMGVIYFRVDGSARVLPFDAGSILNIFRGIRYRVAAIPRLTADRPPVRESDRPYNRSNLWDIVRVNVDDHGLPLGF
jgi:hypothetical protein